MKKLHIERIIEVAKAREIEPPLSLAFLSKSLDKIHQKNENLKDFIKEESPIFQTWEQAYNFLKNSEEKHLVFIKNDEKNLYIKTKK